MSEFQHNGWRSEPTAKARLDKLRLHIAEVTALYGPDVSSGSMSLSIGNLDAMLARLEEEERSLAIAVGGSTATIRATRE